MNHARLWAAIDAIASRHGLTPSGLARRAGLDPTTFNKSKRFTADGRPRWPSTESIAKVLGATGDDLLDLVGAMATAPTDPLPVPSAAVAAAGFRDEASAEEIPRALIVDGEAMLPLYRPGDVLIVSPSAPIAHGDRAVMRLADGRLVAVTHIGETAGAVLCMPVGEPQAPRAVAAAEILWRARILWVSQ